MRRLIFALLAMAMSAAGAHAGALYEERIHADSFGNLVIHSPAGYKRILVGQGYRAAEYSGYRYEGPAVVYLEDDALVLERSPQARHVRRCNREPVLLHGRSYMYGLPDNVVPVPAGICR